MSQVELSKEEFACLMQCARDGSIAVAVDQGKIRPDVWAGLLAVENQPHLGRVLIGGQRDTSRVLRS